MSCYPDADIEVFNEGPRDGTNYSELHLLNGVHRTASSIVEFVDFDDFIPPYVDPKGKKVEGGDGSGAGNDDAGKASCSYPARAADK